MLLNKEPVLLKILVLVFLGPGRLVRRVRLVRGVGVVWGWVIGWVTRVLRLLGLFTEGLSEGGELIVLLIVCLFKEDGLGRRWGEEFTYHKGLRSLVGYLYGEQAGLRPD